MNSSPLGDFFLHRGCPCLSFPSITAAFAEIAIKISTPRFALFSGVRNLNERTLLQRADSVLTDRLIWLTACGLFNYFWSLSLSLSLSFFFGCKFCLSYLLHSPKWTRGLFQPDPDFSISLLAVHSPFLTLSVWFLGHLFMLVASSLLAISLFSYWLSAFYPSTLFSSFPFAFPLFVRPHWLIFVALFSDILASSGSARQPLLSLGTWDVIPPHCILKFYDLRHTDWIEWLYLHWGRL